MAWDGSLNTKKLYRPPLLPSSPTATKAAVKSQKSCRGLVAGLCTLLIGLRSEQRRSRTVEKPQPSLFSRLRLDPRDRTFFLFIKNFYFYFFFNLYITYLVKLSFCLDIFTWVPPDELTPTHPNMRQVIKQQKHQNYGLAQIETPR